MSGWWVGGATICYSGGWVAPGPAKQARDLGNNGGEHNTFVRTPKMQEIN